MTPEFHPMFLEVEAIYEDASTAPTTIAVKAIISVQTTALIDRGKFPNAGALIVLHSLPEDGFLLVTNTYEDILRSLPSLHGVRVPSWDEVPIELVEEVEEVEEIEEVEGTTWQKIERVSPSSSEETEIL